MYARLVLRIFPASWFATYFIQCFGLIMQYRCLSILSLKVPYWSTYIYCTISDVHRKKLHNKMAKNKAFSRTSHFVLLFNSIYINKCHSQYNNHTKYLSENAFSLEVLEEQYHILFNLTAAMGFNKFCIWSFIEKYWDCTLNSRKS